MQQLAMAKEDSNKVNLLNAISFTYAWSDADTGILYAQQAIDVAQKINFEKGGSRCSAKYVRCFYNIRELFPGIGQCI
jgi:hypothetical protein